MRCERKRTRMTSFFGIAREVAVIEADNDGIDEEQNGQTPSFPLQMGQIPPTARSAAELGFPQGWPPTDGRRLGSRGSGDSQLPS